jgi:hypothetical protein
MIMNGESGNTCISDIRCIRCNINRNEMFFRKSCAENYGSREKAFRILLLFIFTNQIPNYRLPENILIASDS